MLLGALVLIGGLCHHFGVTGASLNELEKRKAPATAPLFSSGKAVGTVAQLVESSGLAMSRIHKGVIYSHEDEGDAAVYAINSTNGRIISKLMVEGATNNDWEDIAVGPCGSSSCIYVADTGDKNKNAAVNVIYRIPEPAPGVLAALQVDGAATFKWDHEDGETLMVDPSGNVWLIPKVLCGPKLYMIEQHQFDGRKVDLRSTGTAVNIELDDIKSPTSGDISPDGTEILLRTKTAVWYYKRQDQDSFAMALARTPIKVPVGDEPQGEAVGWNESGNGYYTLSEGKAQPLYFYERLSNPDIVG